MFCGCIKGYIFNNYDLVFFWSLKGSKDEDILLENIRESVDYGTDYVIVAGLNRDYAVCNADYVVK